MSMMKAAWLSDYGGPENLSIRTIPCRPIADDEVMVRIFAASVSSADRRIRSLDMPYGFKTASRLFFGWSKPRQHILGSDLAGEIVAIGRGVKRFQVGDKVVAATGIKLGTHAEFCCLPEAGAIASKPDELNDENACALIFGGLTALHFLGTCQLKPGAEVLINGATGAVGCAMLQLAASRGARITAICSKRNHELARNLGAAEVIDYEEQHVLHGDRRWNLIADIHGNLPANHAIQHLQQDGTLALITASLANTLQGLIRVAGSSKHVMAGAAPENAHLLNELMHLGRTGVIQPIIDSRFPLDQIADAHRRVGSGLKIGSVIVLPNRHPSELQNRTDGPA